MKGLSVVKKNVFVLKFILNMNLWEIRNTIKIFTVLKERRPDNRVRLEEAVVVGIGERNQGVRE